VHSDSSPRRFLQFFTTFQFPLDAPEETEALPEFKITASKDSFDKETNIRSLTIKIEHVRFVLAPRCWCPGYIDPDH
jgi:hypothetical protein